MGRLDHIPQKKPPPKLINILKAPSFLLAEVRQVWGVARSDELSACGGVDRLCLA